MKHKQQSVHPDSASPPVKGDKLNRLLELAKDLESPLEINYNNKSGKILLLDGDFHVYKAANTVKTLDTAIRRFYHLVLTEMFYTGVSECVVYLTPKGCAKCNRYFYPTVKVYQENRVNKVPNPLKNMLMRHLISNTDEYMSRGIKIIYSDWFEADDLIIINSYELKDKGIVSSGDKDMRVTPYSYFEQEYGRIEALDNELGYLTFDSSQSSPLSGRGLKLFFAQMLMGDPADNIRGIITLDGKLCGPVSTFNCIDPLQTVEECAEFIVDSYAEIGQNFLAEAECLWLRRDYEDSAYLLFKEHLSKNWHLNWLEALNNENQRQIQIATREY